jgi:hypothetical protein
MVLFSTARDFHDERHDISAQSTYQVVQCQGCDTVSFRVLSSCSEDYDYETGEYCISETLYPERTGHGELTQAVAMRQYHNLPDKIEDLYRETIGCFEHGFLALCAAGVRALVEGICLDKGVNGKNLEEKIEKLATNDILTKGNAKILTPIGIWAMKPYTI